MHKVLKKAIFLIGLFWLSDVFSQNPFHPFKLTDTEWSISLCDDNQPPNYYTQYYKLCGDTQVGQVNYKKVFYALLPQGATTPSFSFYGLFRQDSVLKRNYIRWPGWSNDSLLMDYSLDVGDTIKTGHYALMNTIGSVILKTDSIIVGGNKVSILYTDTVGGTLCANYPYLGNYYNGSFFLEGLGHYYGMFITKGYFQWETYNCPFEYCDAVGGINFNSGCSGLSVEVSEHSPIITMSPIPTDGKLILWTSTNIEDILLTDILGKPVEVIFEEERNGTLEIDLGNFSRGIYFLILQTSEGYITRKIIKQ